MSLEEALNENTKATRDLIAALAGKGGAAATGTTAGKPGTKGGTKAPTIGVDKVTEKAVAVKHSLGKEAAAKLISTVGKAESLKVMQPENFAAFVEACDKALEAGEVPGDEDDL